MAVCQEFGLEFENTAIPKIASGFAGGIGNSGAVCGAVAGGVMAIGLKLGRADTMEGMLQNLAVAREFRRRFEADMAQLQNSDIAEKVCFPAVATAYRLAVELLRERE